MHKEENSTKSTWFRICISLDYFITQHLGSLARLELFSNIVKLSLYFDSNSITTVPQIIILFKYVIYFYLLLYKTTHCYWHRLWMLKCVFIPVLCQDRPGISGYPKIPYQMSGTRTFPVSKLSWPCVITPWSHYEEYYL